MQGFIRRLGTIISVLVAIFMAFTAIVAPTATKVEAGYYQPKSAYMSLPNPTTTHVGETVSVPLTLSAYGAITGFTAVVSYDSQLVELVGSPITSGSGCERLGTLALGTSVKKTGGNSVAINITSTVPFSVPSQGCTVATLRFKGLKYGSTYLYLYGSMVYSGTQKIWPSTRPGLVNVVPAAPTVTIQQVGTWRPGTYNSLRVSVQASEDLTVKVGGGVCNNYNQYLSILNGPAKVKAGKPATSEFRVWVYSLARSGVSCTLKVTATNAARAVAFQQDVTVWIS